MAQLFERGYDMTKNFIGYVRVSTDRQGKSGLGIEAQREAISSHIGNGKILCEYQEIESGKRDSRPELRRALDHAKRTGATLIVACIRGLVHVCP